MPAPPQPVLVVLKARGQNINPTETVQLQAVFRDPTGSLVDLDAFPQVTVILPTGLVSIGPTSAGVARLSLGKYQFDYMIGIDGPFGVYNDIWSGTASGFKVQATFSFVVENGQIPGINTDGYMALGDEIGFNYSQNAILNVNKLMKTLRKRLNSSGLSKKKDGYGNVVYMNCDIFSVDTLTTLLASALTDFNQVPYFTNFTFEDTNIIDTFHEILVEGATLYALASQALIERGREFQLTDNGLNFTPPTVSEMLNTQHGTLLTHYYDKLKYIKNSMRPAPKGLGSYSITASRNPYISRLRNLRARQII